MKVLLVGFDSAWTPAGRGGLAGALMHADGRMEWLGEPTSSNFREATTKVLRWQRDHAADRTLILLDQPTVVPNETGRRNVERLVSSPICRRHGGVQPASKSRVAMFGDDAPVWVFLRALNRDSNPLEPLKGTCVIETYPILSMIALGWLRDDKRPGGRLPKYNPRRKLQWEDWRFVCRKASEAMNSIGINDLARWLEVASEKAEPSKQDQDQLDSSICLLVAAHLARGGDALFVGSLNSGYMVTFYDSSLEQELVDYCIRNGWEVADSVRKFQLQFATRQGPPETLLHAFPATVLPTGKDDAGAANAAWLKDETNDRASK